MKIIYRNHAVGVLAALLLAAGAAPAMAGPDDASVLPSGAPAPLSGMSTACPTAKTAPDMDAARIAELMRTAAKYSLGERMVFWAERFVGTPYDTDPLGAYVRTCSIVHDSEVDCMYLVFRSAELALSGTPDEAAGRALDMRFIHKGRTEGGKVVNYDDRFQYAEDMVASGKWGEEITGALGDVAYMPGSRGSGRIVYLPKDELLKKENYEKLQNGDICYFVKNPGKRVVGEVVGHLGIIKMCGGTPVLIHGSGTKDSENKKGGGRVKETGLLEYIRSMKFIGLKFTRLTGPPS